MFLIRRRCRINKIIYIICIILLIGFAINGVFKNNIKYPAGKDTVKSFGNGTYQICASETNKGLFNMEYVNCIIQSIEYEYESNNKAYIIGTTTTGGFVDGVKISYRYKLYAVIELENNTMILCITKNSPLQPDLFIYKLDEMIENNNISLIGNLSEFSKEDLEIISKVDGGPLP